MSRPERLFPIASQPGTEPPAVIPFTDELELSIAKATSQQRVRVYGMPLMTGIQRYARDRQTGQPEINPVTQQPVMETVPLPHVAIVSAHSMLPTGESGVMPGSTVIITRPEPGQYDVPIQTRDFLAKQGRVIDGNLWFDHLQSAVFVTDDAVIRNKHQRPERTAQMVVLDETPTSLDLVMDVDSSPTSRNIEVRPTGSQEIDYRVEALAGRIVFGSFHRSFSGVEYVIEGPSGPGVANHVSHVQISATGHMATEYTNGDTGFGPYDQRSLSYRDQASLPSRAIEPPFIGIAPVVEIGVGENTHHKRRRG